MHTIQKSNLCRALDLFSSNATLYVPVENGHFSSFVPYQSGVEVFLNKKTTLGPKSILLPKTEKLYHYKNRGKDSEILSDAMNTEATIIFGVRSCDMQAIECLDNVFLTQSGQAGVSDHYYQAKRANTTIIALSCSQPEADCFCQSMGVDHREHEKADLQLFDLGDSLGIKAHTSKGAELIQLLDNSGLLAHQEVQKLPLADFCLAADTDGLTHKLQKMFEHPLWDDLGKKCLNCGACTYVCPTCHCFDISVCHQDACQGTTIRHWDSCMFTEYSQMAAGHNPRPGKKERVRQRFLHKLRYFPERYGKFLCTGCGRCLVTCPVNLEITQVIQQVKEAEVNG